MTTTLTDDLLAPVVAALRTENEAAARAFPGEREGRQPVHTVYGGAHLFRRDLPAKLGAIARRALDEHAPDPGSFAAAFGLGGDAAFAETIRARVAHKLEHEPVEDLRADFEDGFGDRPDEEEDAAAVGCAREIAAGVRQGSMSPFFGVRIKSLSEETRGRAIRTLDLVVTTLVSELGAIPAAFRITLPKVTIPEHARALARLLDLLERNLSLSPGSIQVELMMESPQALVDESGRLRLRSLVEAAHGRCTGVHFGSYDYTAACDVTAAHQSMTHPSCSFARHLMQVSLARTGVFLSDGATNVMPVPIHKPEPGASLSELEREENRASVHAAWRLHHDNVQDSLRRGFYQGWDLHPAQLVARYAAVYAFFLSSVDASAARLRNFIDRAAQASLLGRVFDDAATGQGLLNFFSRATRCGALTEEEVRDKTGLTLDEVRLTSFAQILARRGSSYIERERARP